MAALRILCIPTAPARLDESPFGPFSSEACPSLDEAARRLGVRRSDAVLIQAADTAAVAEWRALSQAVLDAAVVVIAAHAPQTAVQLLQLGVQDVLAPGPAGTSTDTIARALRLAIERKRLEQTARSHYATDLSTGLPNHTQLLEHMTHLLALREREPAPMALIVLRIEGLSETGEQLGVEAANVLRRKAAVRVRSALRASDVVASIGADAFAVLLAWIESPRDGERVASKIARSLAEPYTVAGRAQMLAVSAGVASYPEHGRAPDALLRRALGRAVAFEAEGDSGPVSEFDRGPAAAANDDEG